MCSKATTSAGFLLILGSILLLVHWKQVGIFRQWKPTTLLAASFCGLSLAATDLFLARSHRYRSMAYVRAMVAHACAMFVAALPYHAAEELLLGPPRARSGRARFVLALAIRFVAWVALVPGCARFAQWRDPAGAACTLSRDVLPVPTYRYGCCPKEYGVAAGGGSLRCYTPRWIFCGCLPDHIKWPVKLGQAAWRVPRCC